jgi:hypothetical protein
LPVSPVLALSRHVARTVPWGTLAAGLIAGLGFSLVIRRFAGPATPQAELITAVRLAFLPPLVSLGFVLHDPHRQLAAALPKPAWLTSAARLCLALPVTAASCWLQLWLVAGGSQQRPLLPLATEFAACCAVMLAVAAAVERGRWHDLGGGAAVPVALAVLAVLAGGSGLKASPVRLLPVVYGQMTAAQRSEWDRAWIAWAVAGTAAALAAAWFSRDPWRRMRHGPARDGGVP